MRGHRDSFDHDEARNYLPLHSQREWDYQMERKYRGVLCWICPRVLELLQGDGERWKEGWFAASSAELGRAEGTTVALGCGLQSTSPSSSSDGTRGLPCCEEEQERG